MSENPYRSPTGDARALGVNSGAVEDLRKVAQYQKGVLTCILVSILATVVQFAAPLPPGVKLFAAFGIMAVSLVGTVFVFLLAMKLYSQALGIVLGVLSLIPCVGLIVLLIVNSKATSVLRQNGIDVGFFGADTSQL